MYREYRMIQDLALVNGGYIKDRRRAEGLLSRTYDITAHYAGRCARVKVKFYRFGGSRIMEPADGSEEEQTEYCALERFLDWVERNEATGYRELLKRRAFLRMVFRMWIPFLTGMVLRSLYLAGAEGRLMDPRILFRETAFLVVSICLALRSRRN